MKSVFNFLYVGYAQPHEAVWNKQRCDSYNRVHIPVSGSAKVRYDNGEEYVLEVGKIYLLPSHKQMFMGSNNGDVYEHAYFDFYVSPLITDQRVIVLDTGEDSVARDFASMFRNRLRDAGKGKYIQFDYSSIPKYMELLLTSLLIYIFDKHKVKQLDNDRLSRALAYIYEHYSEDIDNNDIAESIYVHPRHLTRLFKEELNMTPHQCLTEYRLNMAANMLKDGLQIKDVCRRCGFEDRNTFRKAFKRMNGLPPSEYASFEDKQRKMNLAERRNETMLHNENARPFIDPSKEIMVSARQRPEFDLAPPMSVTGGDYKYQHAQGGCEVNGILYTCMHTPYTSPQKCCIVKQDVRTGELLGISGEYEFGHANDATYNPDENTIVISYCDGTTRMAILDADTLEHKKTVTLEGHVLCNIHYDPITKLYVSVAVQCEAIYVYDSKFALVNSFKGFMTQGEIVEYSMQGCITDGAYVYVLEWHGGKRWGELRGQGGATTKTSSSHFNVFDIKTGKHVRVIDLGIPREIEYATYRDGKFIIGCNNIRWNGLEVWEATLTNVDK